MQLDRHSHVGVRFKERGHAPVGKAAPFMVSAILKEVKSKSILMGAGAAYDPTDLPAEHE